MRETTVEYEVEKTEHEVEHVYCDHCGIECDDDYEPVAQELCSDCQPDESLSWSEYLTRYQDVEDDLTIRGVGEWLLAVGCAPIIVGATILDSLDGNDETAKWVSACGVGMSVWTAITVAVLFLL